MSTGRQRLAAALLAGIAPWGVALARAAEPDLPSIQAAYEAARAVVDPGTHPYDLAITGARCRALAAPTADGAQTACQIDFTRKLEPEGRLYFDVITLAPRAEGGWVLLSGLCMTRAAAAQHRATLNSWLQR